MFRKVGCADKVGGACPEESSGNSKLRPEMFTKLFCTDGALTQGSATWSWFCKQTDLIIRKQCPDQDQQLVDCSRTAHKHAGANYYLDRYQQAR